MIIAVVIISGVICWIIVATIIDITITWLSDYKGQVPLVEVIKEKIRFIKRLRVFK